MEDVVGGMTKQLHTRMKILEFLRVRVEFGSICILDML